MTTKSIALALLATSAMASQECGPEAPWGSQSNFSVEISGGAATMGGSPYSTTGTAAPSPQMWNDFQVASEGDGIIKPTFTVEIDTPAGYRANWNKMTPSANRLGFAGQLNLHYTAVQGAFAGGVYAGVGYNGAHSSSTIKENFDNTVYQNSITVELNAVDDRIVYGKAGTSYAFSDLPNDLDVTLTKAPTATNALAERAAMHANMPMAKATVSSGLMFNAGARMGTMIGNVFPHLRLGWAAYQLKAHMTNQMAPFSASTDIYADATTDAEVLANGGLSLINPGNANMGAAQRFGDLSPLYKTPSAMKVSSKGSKWANAITLGGGVDWAFQKMTMGFYYQAAICQRVTFDSWNKEMTAGITASNANFPTTPQTGINANLVKTSGTVVNTYGAAKPKVSISPVIHTVMFSAKYVLNKA